ncbi:MAG TPA: DNA repair protein RadA [Gemmatimonadaceae bacterium]
MTVRTRTVYRCSECGAEYPKWGGRCDACGEWNTLVEETAPASRGADARRSRLSPPVAAIPIGEVLATRATRTTSGLRELDYVLGGGIVDGSVVLIGGEPGIGKSTLLLQVAAGVAGVGRRALYVSAEESAPQVRLRAERLDTRAMRVELLAETDLESILAVAATNRPDLLVIDSIQTIYHGSLEGAPGSVGQVRECAARLMRFAKESGCAVFIVGHVTKGGGVAGPKTLEHIVDTVLYFEGEASLDFRVLRSTKNRFGSIDEIGVFRMTGSGLEAVENPSALFMGDGAAHSSGTAVTALLEGSRPILVEIQALATKAGYGTPQRVANGVDPRRLALLLAVLEKRSGIPVSQLDVFVNVAGGLRLSEPAGDLAVAAAVASSMYDVPLPHGAVFIGELGLGGEIRAVTQVERRLAEAEQLGMTVAFLGARGKAPRGPAGLRLALHEHLGSLFESLFRP